MLLESLKNRLESHKMGVQFGTPTWNLKKEGAPTFAGSHFGPFFGEICLERPPRAAKSDSNFVFRLQEPPRALQEGSKTLSEGIRVEDAIRIPFWTHFWLEEETLRP